VTRSVSALAAARLYLVSDATIAGKPLVSFVPELAAAGVDVLQLRAKHAEAGDLLRWGAELKSACVDAGLPFVINDRPDVAALLGTGVHVGQNDLPVQDARRFVGGHPAPGAARGWRRLVPGTARGPGLVGLSTHARAEIDAACAAADPPDYIAVGPLFETPTKPGRSAVGLELARYAAERVRFPWFAIGGIDGSNLAGVLDAGARRVVVVRAITEAPDPVAATAALRAMLDDAPL
jgi:thiamine-phosphate pyrophosphorylase